MDRTWYVTPRRMRVGTVAGWLFLSARGRELGSSESGAAEPPQTQTKACGSGEQLEHHLGCRVGLGEHRRAGLLQDLLLGHRGHLGGHVDVLDAAVRRR